MRGKEKSYGSAFFAAALYCCAPLCSQNIQLNAFFNPQPPANFYLWNEQPQMQIQVQLIGTQPAAVKFHFELKTFDGRNVANSDPGLEPFIELNPGPPQTIPQNQIFTTDFFSISKAFGDNLGKSGRFPSGNFEICISVVDAEQGRPLGPGSMICRPFFIQSQQAPLLIFPPDKFPVCGQDLTFMVFQWTHTLHDFSGPQYHFVLAEIYPGQTPAEAINSNFPIVEEFLFENQWTWPENLLAPGDSQDYVWGVNVLDRDIVISDYTGLHTTTCRRPRGDSTITRDPETPSTPEEPRIPTTTTRDKCSPCAVENKPGTSVELGMILDDPKSVQYPRAVPLRADGVDLDVVKLICSGCKGGVSEKPFIFKDDVGNYEWTLLNDKGSLNTPFDVKAIDSLSTLIAELVKKIADLKDSLTAVNDLLKEGLDKKKKGLEKELERKKELLKKIIEEKKSETTRADSIKQAIKEKNKVLNQINSEIQKLVKDISKIHTQIDSLQKSLQSKPSAEEVSLMKTIDDKNKSLEKLKTELEQKEKDWIKALEEIKNKLINAQKDLESAVKKYNAEKDAIEGLSRTVIGIESRLMSTPDGREFISVWRDWKRKNALFDMRYGESKYETTIEQVSKAAFETLKTAESLKRQNGLESFFLSISQLTAMQNKACGGKEECRLAVKEIQQVNQSFSDVMIKLASGSFILDAAQLLKVDTLRKIISGRESNLVTLKKAVDNAVQSYEIIQQEYFNKIGEIEKSRDSYLKNISTLTDEIAGLTSKLKLAKEQRLNDDENKKQGRLDKLSELKTSLVIKENSLQLLSDSAQDFKLKIKDLERYLSETNDKIQKLSEKEESTNKSISELEKSIKNIEEERKQLEKKKKKLEEEIKKLEEELAKLSDGKKEKLKGNKTAVGPIVYYIPPPLEDVMKNEKRFKELKDSVALAEAFLSLAYAQKEAVQLKLVKEIEKVATLLKKYKDAKEAIAAADKRIAELEDEIKKAKTKKYQESLEDQKKAQEAVIKSEKEKETAQQEKENAEKNKEKTEKEVEELKKKIEVLRNELLVLENTFREMDNELKYEEGLLSNARNTVNERNAQIKSEEANLTALELELGQQKNDLTRARAKDDTKGAEQLLLKIQETEAKLKLLKETKLPDLRTKAKSAVSSVESAIKRVDGVKEKNKAEMEKYRKKLEDLNDLHSQLIKKNEELEGKHYELSDKEKKLKEAENKLESDKKKKDELNENIEKGALDDKEVKTKTDEKAAAEDTKKKSEEIMKKSAAEIKSSLSKKDRLINEAKDNLDKAKDRVKKAKNDLREFLLGEFDSVDFKAVIQLKGKDLVVDKWRTGDGEKIIVNTLKYPSDRIPQFDGKPAQSEQPSEPVITAVCNPEHNFTPPPGPSVTGPVASNEPRTIALIYKEGEPLWPEWPVIKPDAPRLAKDIVPLYTGGTDNDMFTRYCVTSNGKCPPSLPITEEILDLGIYLWEVQGDIVGHSPYNPAMLWRPDEVKKPKKEELKETKVYYLAKDIAEDDKTDAKSKQFVKPGVLLECSKDTSAKPEAEYVMQGRVVKGDHTGLIEEDVEFEAVLVKGSVTDWGFDGKKPKVLKQTQGGGYAKSTFNFGKGFGEWEISIRWLRGGEIMEEAKLKAISPLLLKLHRFSNGAPDYAFEGAMKLFESGGDAEAGISGFPKEKDKGAEGGFNLRGVAGLMDFERDFVNSETVEFSVDGKRKPDPEKDKTKLFGIAKTHVKGVEEEEKCALTAKSEEKYRPVTKPEKATKEFSNSKANKFKIGIASNPFVIVMDEEFNSAEPVNGSGRLGMEIEGTELLQYLKEVKFEAQDVNVSGVDEDNLVAESGTVIWEPGSTGKLSILGLDFDLEKVKILAQTGAGLTGKVKHSKIPNPVKFDAELDADGNFLGSLDSLPELEIKGFKLKQGTAFDIDMHEEKSPGTLEASFQGLLIRTAKLELPEVFNGKNDEKSVLEVSDFYLGRRDQAGGGRSFGFGGKASLTGSFFNMGYAGYEFTVQELSLEFENSSLTAGSFKGELALPIPFEGKVQAEVAVSGDGFTAKAGTDRPVTIPKLGISMTFLSGTGIEYVAAQKLGKLTINAFMVTRAVGEVELKGFEVTSKGDFKVDEISLEKSLKFGSGFDLHAKSLKFFKTGDQYSFTVKGSFAFPRIGIENVKGGVTVSNGPSVSVSFEQAKIKFEYNIFSFDGEFKYNGREFNGKFEIGIKKVLENGIQGQFVVGNLESDGGATFNYWYAQLSVGVKIPIGQSGLVLLGLGGGLGYNYIPPIGRSEGSPQNNGSFSFKAMITAGTQPGGEVFAGEMEMVLVPGSFSLYGKTWLLNQKQSIYGDGQLNIRWAPKSQVDGYIGMFVGLPNADGNVFLANGKINFMFAGTSDFSIKSETLKASVFQAVNGSGNIDVNTSYMDINGKLYYHLNKSLSLGIVTAKAMLNLEAQAGMKYVYKPKTVNANASFTGEWDVDLETPLGTADITSGYIRLDATFTSTPNYIDIRASAKVSYDVWIYADTVNLDLGYHHDF